MAAPARGQGEAVRRTVPGIGLPGKEPGSADAGPGGGGLPRQFRSARPGKEKSMRGGHVP